MHGHLNNNPSNEEEVHTMPQTSHPISSDQEHAVLTVLSVADVAEYLCVGKNRVYELLNTGKLKGFRIGVAWKISQVALEAYILDASKL